MCNFTEHAVAIHALNFFRVQIAQEATESGVAVVFYLDRSVVVNNIIVCIFSNCFSLARRTLHIILKPHHGRKFTRQNSPSNHLQTSWRSKVTASSSKICERGLFARQRQNPRPKIPVKNENRLIGRAKPN